MSLVAPVEDGKIVDTASSTSVSKASRASNTYDKDTFLKLLVAEVQNQDPMEPASNTEWVSQYATFSELESMQNMSASYDLSRASTLVGKTVIMKVTDSTGTTDLVQGKVDFVTYENGKALLSINGSLYSLDDLYNVVDETYLNAYDKAYDWTVGLNKLPGMASLDASSKEKIDKLYEAYQNMNEYEKSFVASDNATKIQEYYDKLQELLKVIEAGNAAADKEEAEKEAEDVADILTEELEETEKTGEAGQTQTDDETAEILAEALTKDLEETKEAETKEAEETAEESGAAESVEEGE